MKRFLLLLSLILSLQACNNEKSGTQVSGTPESNQADSGTAEFPSLPLETLKQLYEECTMIDYIFYELPLSMSVDQKPSIQSTLRHIADTPAVLKTTCKPVGHITYQISGNIVLEADFYYSQGCTYFVFYVNRQKAYANYMTQEGANSIGNLIQQGMQMQKSATQGN